MFNAKGIEACEIMGDWYEEMRLEEEREEANRLAPEPEPLTDAEIEDWYQRWLEENPDAAE